MLLLLVFFVLSIGLSEQLDCSNPTYTFTKHNESVSIDNTNTVFPSDTCNFTFILPTYFLPLLYVDKFNLPAKNAIGIHQVTEYGGAVDYPISDRIDLAPVNFILRLVLPDKNWTNGTGFSFTIRVINTQAKTSNNFTVDSDLGKVDWPDSFIRNTSYNQVFDKTHPKSKFFFHVFSFSEFNSYPPYSQYMHVYDEGQYKGNFFDILKAAKNSKYFQGTQFTINPVVEFYSPSFNFMISPVNGTGMFAYPTVFNTVSYPTNPAIEYSALNGSAVVFREIAQSSYLKSRWENIKINANGRVDVYAGCVTGPQESRRVATITPENAAKYNLLQVYGLCRTIVLQNGTTFESYRSNYNYNSQSLPIGSQGVIMNEDFPYPSQKNQGSYFMLQAMDNSSKIVVNYEVAHISPDSTVSVVQSSPKKTVATKQFVATDTVFQSKATFQQNVTFIVPPGSNGFLIRFTVQNSAVFKGGFSTVLALVMGFKLLFI